MPKKNNYKHKIVFTWFRNLSTSTELQRFYYYQGKIQSAAVQFFSLSKVQPETLITKKRGFYILHTGFTMCYKTGQIFFSRERCPWTPKRLVHGVKAISTTTWPYWPKPPLYGLSFKKSPIKNHTTLFELSQVKSSSRSNTTRLHKAQYHQPLHSSSHP